MCVLLYLFRHRVEFGAALPPLVGKVSNIHALNKRRERLKKMQRGRIIGI